MGANLRRRGRGSARRACPATANTSAWLFRSSTISWTSSNRLRPWQNRRQGREQKKITFPAVYGIERSHGMAEQERLAAHSALQPFGSSTSVFAN